MYILDENYLDLPSRTDRITCEICGKFISQKDIEDKTAQRFYYLYEDLYRLLCRSCTKGMYDRSKSIKSA